MKVDGDPNLFAGPTQLVPAPLEESRKDSRFPGVHGRRRLLMGGEARRLLQAGELEGWGSSPEVARAVLVALRDRLLGLAPGTTSLAEGEHTLVTDDGIVYGHCALDADSFEQLGPIDIYYRGLYVAVLLYRCAWTQLQPFGATEEEAG